VVDVLPGPDLTVVLSDGRELAAAEVVLAFGQAPPTFPPGAAASVYASPDYIADPWRVDALDGVRPAARVLLLGTGLTAVDVALSLAGRGHAAPVLALSRHGVLPLPHTVAPAAPVTVPDPPRPGLGPLLRQVIGAARTRDWRAVVDALRNRTDRIWADLSDADRERFLSHVLRYWETHRHRSAPAAADAVDRLIAQGSLIVHKGQLWSLAPGGTGLTVHVGLSGGALQRWDVDVVVNRIGPGRPAGLPLIRTLAGAGLVRADRDHLGIEVDDDGRPVHRDGTITPGLFAVGALRRGVWWETTAIPELRRQAFALADTIGSRVAAGR
jgi:uncharacterized NAD(P)/FAD-binding protein YdhS